MLWQSFCWLAATAMGSSIGYILALEFNRGFSQGYVVPIAAIGILLSWTAMFIMWSGERPCLT